MTNPPCVVDTSLALYVVLDTPHSEAALRVWNMFQGEKRALLAPRLWHYEITSVIHRYLFEKILDSQESEQALKAIFRLSVSVVDEDESLCRSAFHWASRLGHKAAYDSFYVALAERIGAELWTADERLVNRSRQMGISWVRWMEEV